MDFLNDTLGKLGFGDLKKTKLEAPTPPNIEEQIDPINVQVKSNNIEDVVIETIENPLIFEDEMSKMNITIRKSLKMRFKNKCARSGTDMSKVVNFWVKQFLALDNMETPHNEN